MNIDDMLLKRLLRLSCINLSPDEKTDFKSEAGLLMAQIGKLSELEIAEISKTSRYCANINVFREDKVESSTKKEEILSQAASKEGRYICVHKTVEQESKQ